ncbi:hypothetical protein RchiOBHm_Chr2g0113221 [Rosa chinensis]|uniref:Uncharacterized protein n=1 Tax=Rosa chinensis TaxID=74649 RepID=A0A2P6RQG9_ROSCH|nr:hypothetical protein RchiOBHm_Chr2g0113221 [Rosa chinensis]
MGCQTKILPIIRLFLLQPCIFGGSGPINLSPSLICSLIFETIPDPGLRTVARDHAF